MKKTTKYLAALRTIKANKLNIRVKENSDVYAALCRAGYIWNPELGSWEIMQLTGNSNPKRGLVKLRIIAYQKYAVDVGEILEGMMGSKGFTKFEGPSISPSRKDENETLIYYTFKLPGYDKAFPSK